MDAPQARSPHKFIVVDDDDAFRTRLVTALRARGLEAVGAGSASEALKVAADLRPDAAIIDLRMPEVSGLDLVSELAARFPQMQTVVLTGYGSIATAVEAVRRGAIHYLQKPLDTDEILAAFDTGSDAAGAPRVETPSLARVEWEHIQRILHDCNGNISLAARKLGLHRRSLQRKLSKYPPSE